MFSPGFREWFTSREQGHIEEESLVKNLNSLMMNNDPFGIIGLKGAEGVVSILAQDKSQSRLFNFVRSEIDMNARAGGGADKVSNICFINSRPGGPAGFRKGVYRMGEFCLLASDDFAQMQEYVDNALLKASSENKRVSIPPKIELTDGRRILAFERGKGRLFISGSEVTGGWGLYTSIFSPDYGNNGFWHSSCDAIWEQVRLKKNRLLVKGNWPYLPITQLWEFILSPEGIIWRIDMQVHSRVRISRRQAKLMLLGEFVRWRCGRGKAAGVFPEGHPPSSWEMLYKDADNLCVGAENNCSGVEFAFLAGKENVFFSVIENSNALFKSRVIGFENAAASCEGEIIEPGVYNYFEGRVSF